ncbi:hypothetical protein [Enterobacter roggenkampii]|uniref:hypothetical protein n=1 Tax=Enterobacter roggenkampii TaxID=1812935 RepID=UPI0025AD5AF4|nr:hypothetical protein [Enterobacter roggenkampii]WJS49457.1 hypothetical protein QU521_15030 [Enterobacter roggenkampii]
MSNIDKMKSAAAKSVDNFDPNMFVETRDVLALLDELETKDKRIADQCGIIASARKFISDYAGLGDVGAAEFIKIIDRAASGKGE